MGTRQRPADRGSELARRGLVSVAREFQLARRDRGLSLRAVAAAVGVSAATVWRFERNLSTSVGLRDAARFLAVVGLDLSVRTYPGPTVLRDGAHADLLGRFRGLLHASVRWGSEVPLPELGDQRRWDALLTGTGWRYGVEAETGPQDGQALAGRLNQKVRDGGVDGVLLVLPGTRRVRAFLDGARVVLDPLFPVAGPVALERLRAGHDPEGSAIIVLPRRRPVSPGESTSA